MRGAWARPVLDKLFPPVCPVTGDEVSSVGALSPEAWDGLAFFSGALCEVCGREVPGGAEMRGDPDLRCDACLQRGHLWDRGRAAFRYEGTGRHLVLALKHGDRLDLAVIMAAWMRNAAGPLVKDADLIVPVPLHWTRMLKRRYNQSAELARAICRQAGRRDAYAPGLIRRARRTPVQDGRDRAGRTENVSGAFSLTPGSLQRIKGRRVLLIDDVMTTGATLDALATLLREAGAGGIDVLVSALVNYQPAFYMRDDVVIEELEDETD
ncbi:MAG: ComF family protein [Pseudomonadota bacterium]